MSKTRHILGVSGGKDSAALAIYLRDKVPDMEYVFCDTATELPETYDFIEKLEVFLNKHIVRLPAELPGYSNKLDFDHYLDLYGGYLPSAAQRWCTKKLKLDPFEKYFGDDKVINYVGIRADENRLGYLSTSDQVETIFPFVDDNIDKNGVLRILNESGVDRFIMSPDFEVRPVGVQEMYVFSSTEERSGRFEKGASLRIEKQEDGPDIVIAFNIPPLRDHKDKGLYFRLKQAYVELRNRKAIKPQLWGHHGLQAVADFVGGSELETRVSSVENFFQALGRDAMRRSVNAEISKREENAREWLEAETRLILPPMRPGSDLKRAFERCRALKVKEGNSQEMVSAFGDEEAEDHGALEAALTVYNHANSLGLQHLDRNGRLFAVISAVMNFLNRNLDGISETVAEAEARFQAPLAKEQQLYDLYRTIELIHQFGLNLINKGLNAEGMEFVSFAQSMCVPVTRMATSFDTSGTIASLRNSDPLKVWERVATQLADRYAVREILPLDPDSVISQTRQEMVNERDGQEEVRPRSAAQRLAEDLDAARKRDAARRAGQQRES